MQDKWLTVGVLQVEYHAAAIVGDLDFLREPLPGPFTEADQSLSSLARYGLDIEKLLGAVRTRYIDWLSTRLKSLLDELVATGQALPDLLILPECSVPLECLHVLREYCSAYQLTILAGTHTPLIGDSADRYYKNAGVRPAHLAKVREAGTTLQVLPVMDSGSTKLVRKHLPSVFEKTDLTAEVSSVRAPEVETITLKGFDGVRVAVMICADALRANQIPECELAIIVALQKEPLAFRPTIDRLRSTGTPVVFVNHGRFGGSGVFVNADQRQSNWFFASPLSGALPPGECYLEVRINLLRTAPQVGTAAPQSTAELSRVMPIMSRNDLFAIDTAARDAFLKADAPALQACVAEIPNIDRPGIVPDRWRYLLSRLRNQNATSELVSSVGSSLPLNASLPLVDLEGELRLQCAEQLDTELQQAGNMTLDDEAYGRASKLLRHLRTPRKSFAPPAASRTPILDRLAETSMVRDFINERRHVLVVLGLPQMGKSSVITKALAEANVPTVELQCREGASADYLFEILLGQADRIASTTRPRATFDADELEPALARYRVVWLRDAHHLVAEQHWATPALGALMRAILRVQEKMGFTLIVETIRWPPLDASGALEIRRYEIRGLPEPDSRALFLNQLRSFRGSDDINPDVLKSLVRQLAGHPKLLSICADACKTDSPEAVLQELETKRGRIVDAIGKLVEHMKLTADEKLALQCLCETRASIPVGLLEVVVAPDAGALQTLVGSSLVERDSENFVSVSPLVRQIVRNQNFEEKSSKAYHRAASQHFASLHRAKEGAEAFVTAIEANYHAGHAGISAPCALGGLLDDVVARAKEDLARENYEGVISTLEPIMRPQGAPWVIAKSRADLVAIYAEALSWSARFKEALECVEALVQYGGAEAAEHFLTVARGALSSGRNDIAQQCVDNARRHAPGSAQLPIVEGRLLERKHDFLHAVERYQYAASMPRKNRWSGFYLSRCLVRLDRLDEALAVIDSSLNDEVVDNVGRVSTILENALRSVQMEALVLSSRLSEARNIAEALQGSKDLRPEVRLCLAYVNAASEATKDKDRAVMHFEAAIANLPEPKRGRRIQRARVALYRGKLYEIVGNTSAAEEALRDASSLQAFNKHTLICHERALERLLSRHQDDQAAKDRLAKVREDRARLEESRHASVPVGVT